MFRKLKEKQKLYLGGEIYKESFNQSLESYLEILKYCDGYGLEMVLKNKFEINNED